MLHRKTKKGKKNPKTMDSHLPCNNFIKLVRCMRNMVLKLFAYKKKRYTAGP